MSDRMSAAEYQREIVAKARSLELEDEQLLEQLREPGKKKTARKKEEDEITIAVATYIEDLIKAKKVVCFSHIPNSTYTKYWSIKNKNTAMGVRPGVPDMVIVFPDRVLFLELKKQKGGVVSPYQKVWIDALQAVSGTVVAQVAAGLEEAKAVIDSCI